MPDDRYHIFDLRSPARPSWRALGYLILALALGGIGCDGDLHPILAPIPDHGAPDQAAGDISLDLARPDTTPDSTPDSTLDSTPDVQAWCTASSGQKCKVASCGEYLECAEGEGICAEGQCCEGACTEAPKACMSINDQVCRTAECGNYLQCNPGEGTCEGAQHCCLGDCTE